MNFQKYSPKRIIEDYHQSRTVDNIIIRIPHHPSPQNSQKHALNTFPHLEIPRKDSRSSPHKKRRAKTSKEISQIQNKKKQQMNRIIDRSNKMVKDNKLGSRRIVILKVVNYEKRKLRGKQKQLRFLVDCRRGGQKSGKVSVSKQYILEHDPQSLIQFVLKMMPKRRG